MLTVRRLVLALIVCVSMSQTLRATDIPTFIQKFPAPTAAEREAYAAELFKDGAAAIQSLSKMLVEPGKGDDKKVRFALEGMAIHASRPGGDSERKLFAQTVASELSGDFPPMIKTFLLIQLRITAGDEQVADIAKLLSDKELSDPAAQTLLTIRTPSVASALRSALATVKEGPRVTVINAIGALRDKDASAEILKDAENPDIEIKNAALRALAAIGDDAAAPFMTKAANVDNWNNRNQALQAALSLAQRLVELGKKSEAAAICRTLAKTEIALKESHLQCAALNILATADADAAFDDLKAALKNTSPEVRATALGIAASIPGAAITQRWAAELKGADPKFAVELLGVLERRNDSAAFAAVSEATQHTDASVRAAAFRAAVVGGKNAVPVLLTELGKEATKDNADELTAARTALAHVKGEGVNSALAAALPGDSPNLRKILISTLAERNAVEYVGELLAATNDTDSGVRTDAFEAVGKLGGVKEFPLVLNTIVKTDNDDNRTAAEKSAATIASHTQDKAALASATASAMNGASVKARQTLLRVLGKIGGADALAALKPSLTGAETDIVDTAVHEIAAWPDSSALPELLDVAKNATTLPHNALALTGYVRLLAENKHPTNDYLPKYEAAMALCRRVDEKKKIISGIQNVKTPEGASVVEGLMSDETLREEACNAAMNIAKELAKTHKDQARPVFEKVLATTKRAEMKKNAQSEIDKLK